MWKLDYSGLWSETPYRGPEPLTVLAPAHLQEECLRTGGTNLYGRPRFRLAWTPSRFLIAGGYDVNHLDAHGNYIFSRPDTVLVPRYAMVERQFQDSYILERWRSPDWYDLNGFGKNAVEYDGVDSVQVFEPIWSEGGYEAVLRDIEDPQIFPRDVTTQTIYKAIRWSLISLSYSLFQKCLDRRQQRMVDRTKLAEKRVEILHHHIGPFGVSSFSAYGQTSRRA